MTKFWEALSILCLVTTLLTGLIFFTGLSFVCYGLYIYEWVEEEFK